MADDFVDWAARVTLVVTYDPSTEQVVVDRGALPRRFAIAILADLDGGDFLFSDEQYADADVED